MERYRCFALDDEPLALNVIEEYIRQFAFLDLVGKSTDPASSLGQISATQPHLLFLDIQMPVISGLEFIHSLHYKPEIILTTAYRDFAVEGFELNVLDYLVKPIPFPRFAKAIDKFLHHTSVEVPLVAKDDFIYVKADRKQVKIDLDDILYVEGVKDYVRIILPHRTIITKFSIGQFIRQLPPARFLQVHKSFVVSLHKITAYSAVQVEIGGVEIPIGRTHKEQVTSILNRQT